MVNLQLIQNEPKYYEFIRQLRNDPRVQPGFIRQTEITPEQQLEYMKTHASNYYICLFKSIPVGYVGQIDGDIRVATHPDYQRLGIAKFMINELMKLFPQAYAKVKIDNEASRKLFESVGFKVKYYLLEKDAN